MRVSASLIPLSQLLTSMLPAGACEAGPKDGFNVFQEFRPGVGRPQDISQPVDRQHPTDLIAAWYAQALTKTCKHVLKRQEPTSCGFVAALVLRLSFWTDQKILQFEQEGPKLSDQKRVQLVGQPEDQALLSEPWHYRSYQLLYFTFPFPASCGASL